MMRFSSADLTSVRSSRPPAGAALAHDLDRWVAAGLLTDTQADAILALDLDVVIDRDEAAPEPVSVRRIPAVAEALGYLGGLLAIVGLVLVVVRYWPDMGAVPRLALSAGAASAFLAGGAGVRDDGDPALARLRWFLWLGSTAAAAVVAGVVSVDVFEAESPKSIVVAAGAAVAFESGLLWQRRARPLQQLTFLGGLVVAVGALVAQFAPSEVVGIVVITVGSVYVLAGLRRATPFALLTEGCGAIAVLVGSAITAEGSPSFGLPLQVATALALLALATVPGLAPDRGDHLTLGLVGGFALLQATPASLGYFAEGAGVATGTVLWLFGGGLVFIGMRRAVRTPRVAEALGGAALIGGAALTGTQSDVFAPLFGIATAVGLVALGMIPGQVLMSVLGSAGLLINVPWAIARFFPGEGRVPLLILVSGGLILAIAVLLTHRGGRARRDGAERPPRHRGRHGPGIATGAAD